MVLEIKIVFCLIGVIQDVLFGGVEIALGEQGGTGTDITRGKQTHRYAIATRSCGDGSSWIGTHGMSVPTANFLDPWCESCDNLLWILVEY